MKQGRLLRLLNGCGVVGGNKQVVVVVVVVVVVEEVVAEKETHPADL